MLQVLHKGFKYRIYPTKQQQQEFSKIFGCCRFVYNYFLAKSIYDYNNIGSHLSVYESMEALTELKRLPEYSFLAETDSQALNKCLKSLGEAYTNFYKKLHSFPKFKKKSSAQSYTTAGHSVNVLQIYDNKILIPKVGLVKIKYHRPHEGRVLNGTITKTSSGKYYISLTCIDCNVTALPTTSKDVGIDLGLTSYASTSTGEVIDNPRFLRRLQDKLSKEQSKLDRKTQGSNNYEKQRLKVAKVHEHIANQRRDFIHKLTTNLVKNHDLIAVEDLKVMQLLNDDAGTMHRCQVKGMNKSLYDASWYMFLSILEYKTMWYGRTFIKVDRTFPSSQICNNCGYINKKVRHLSVRKWRCSVCSVNHDRDINAAINILAEAKKMKYDELHWNL